MHKKIIAGGVVIGPNNKIVVVNQNNDSWSLPKGHVEKGEKILQAAKREIHEETGLDINKLKLIKKLGVYERFSFNKGAQTDNLNQLGIRHIYLFKTSQKTLQPLDSENPRAQWLPIKQVREKLSHPKDKEFFKTVEKQIYQTL